MSKAYFVDGKNIRVFDFTDIEKKNLLTMDNSYFDENLSCLELPARDFRTLYNLLPEVTSSSRLIAYVNSVKTLPQLPPDSYWQSLIKNVVLRPFQIEFLNFAETRRLLNGPPKGKQKGVICSLDQGLGKTIVGIAWDIHLRKLGIVKKTLIVCKRNNKRSTWKKHLERLTDLTIVDIGGDKPQRLKAFKRLYTKVDIALIHYEAFRIHPNEVTKHIDHMIFDEAQKIANHESLQSHVADLATDKAKAVTLLSGGVAQNKIETQFWHPLYSVDRYEWQSYAEWLMKYCAMKEIYVPIYWKGKVVMDWITKKPKTRKMKIIDGLKNRVELSKRMSSYLYQKSKWEVAEQLPPKIYQVIETSLTPKQRKLYMAVRDDISNQTKGISIPIALTKTLRLYQVCATLEYFDMGDESKKAEEAVEAILEIVPENKKALIFTQHVLLAKTIHKRLLAENAKALLLIGETKDTEKNSERDAIRESFKFKNFNFLVTTMQVEGEGSDYPEATYVFRLDRDHRPLVNLQAEDRAHRLVSTAPVNIIDFVSADTIEEVQLEVLNEKANNIRDVTDLTKIFTSEDIKRMIDIAPRATE